MKFRHSRRLTSASDLQAERIQLSNVNTRLLALNKFADEKIKALATFGARRDISWCLQGLKLDPSDLMLNIIADFAKSLMTSVDGNKAGILIKHKTRCDIE